MRKYFLAIAALLLCSSSAWATIAQDQAPVVQAGCSSSTTCTLTLTSVASGDMIHVSAAWPDSQTFVSITDGGDTFTNTSAAPTDSAWTTRYTGDWYVCSTSKSGTVSVVIQISGAATITYILGDTWMGVKTSGCLDTSGTRAVTSTTANPSVATAAWSSSTNELGIGCANYGSALTVGTGWTALSNSGTTSKCEYILNPSGCAVTSTWTSTATEGVLFVGAFLPASGGAANPCVAQTYFLATAAGGGSDSNSGTSSGSPWLTPNHALNCGDLISAAASTAYVSSNFSSSSWGVVSCPSSNNVAWLKCATFDACKITETGGAYVMNVGQSFWGVQGWELSATTTDNFNSCFTVNSNNGVSVHHIIFANDISKNCEGGGFGFADHSTSISWDYGVMIGNWAYNSATGTSLCYSGFSVYQPIALDTLPGTHIYIAGNIANDNVDGNMCGGGVGTDGEGITLDTLDFSQGGGSAYTQQVVVDNNITIFNGNAGINEFGGGNTLAHVYIRHNTVYGNQTDVNQSDTFCGQVIIAGSTNGARLTEGYQNLVMTQAATAPACGGSNPVYTWSASLNNTTDHVYNNYLYSAAGNNTQVINNAGSFAYGPNNTTGTNPSFVNPVDPGAPSCGSASSVPNCMATVIANFTPTTAAAKAYGYQIPSTTSIYDPLYPQWLCTVTNLPTGLVTPGCVTGSAIPSGVTMSGATIH